MLTFSNNRIIFFNILILFLLTLILSILLYKNYHLEKNNYFEILKNNDNYVLSMLENDVFNYMEVINSMTYSANANKKDTFNDIQAILSVIKPYITGIGWAPLVQNKEDLQILSIKEEIPKKYPYLPLILYNKKLEKNIDLLKTPYSNLFIKAIANNGFNVSDFLINSKELNINNSLIILKAEYNKELTTISFVSIDLRNLILDKYLELFSGNYKLTVTSNENEVFSYGKVNDINKSIHTSKEIFLGSKILKLNIYQEEIFYIPFTFKVFILISILLLSTYILGIIYVNKIRLNSVQKLEHSTKSLEQQNLHLNQFISNISHEFRTPLNSIVGFSQLMLEYTDNLPEQVNKNIKSIYKSGKHLSDLVDQVLSLSAIEKEAIQITSQKTYIGNIIFECVDIIKPIAEKEKLSIYNYVPLDLDTPIRVNPVYFKQIVINLLSNAIKYNKPNGKVVITHEVHKNKIHILITDSGVGIDESKFGEIFEPFVRLKEKDEVPGLGIGLCIIKKMIEQMNGSISVSSQIGKGSVFTVEFDIVK